MALTSPNMGLRIWTATADRYDHDQAAANFAKIDYHDHTPGRGIQIPTEGIYDGAVNYAKISRASLQTVTVASGISIPSAAYGTFSITWPTAWPDANYNVFIGFESSNNSRLEYTVTNKTPTTTSVQIYNADPATATAVAIRALGVHA